MIFGLLREVVDAWTGKKDTAAEWAAKLIDEELRSYYMGGPNWLDSDEYNAVLDEMERRNLPMPHVPVR